MYVIKGPKLVVPPQGYRLPSDNERDKLGQMSSEIDRLRGMISATSGDQKKEFIRMRRDLNADMIDFMEKHKIYYVPGGQMQKVKFVESIVDEVKKELLLEGGAGSGNWGHKGRPGHRGGSLPGGGKSGVSAHEVPSVSSSRMAGRLKQKGITNSGEAMTYLKRKYPGQPEDRYGRAITKAGMGGAGIAASPKVASQTASKVRNVKGPVSPSAAGKSLGGKSVETSTTTAEGLGPVPKHVSEIMALKSSSERMRELKKLSSSDAIFMVADLDDNVSSEALWASRNDQVHLAWDAVGKHEPGQAEFLRRNIIYKTVDEGLLRKTKGEGAAERLRAVNMFGKDYLVGVQDFVDGKRSSLPELSDKMKAEIKKVGSKGKDDQDFAELMDHAFRASDMGTVHMYFRKEWTSGKTPEIGLALADHARKIYGGKMYYPKEEVLRSAHALFSERITGNEALAMTYIRTLKAVNRQVMDVVYPGSNDLTLYRGTGVEELTSKAAGVKALVASNPLSSWTTERKVADEFGTFSLGQAAVLEGRVKRDDILVHHTMFPFQNQKEFVVISPKPREVSIVKRFAGLGKESKKNVEEAKARKMDLVVIDRNADDIDWMRIAKTKKKLRMHESFGKLINVIAGESIHAILEGGPGSGNWGHAGRPGHRGGSLPGGGKGRVSAHEVPSVSSSRMAGRLKQKGITNSGEAMTYLKRKYPGQPEDRYGRAITKAGMGGAGIAASPKVGPELGLPKAKSGNKLRTADVSKENTDIAGKIKEISEKHGFEIKFGGSFPKGNNAMVKFYNSGKQVGRLHFKLRPEFDDVYLDSFFMDKAFQNTGLGGDVVEQIVNYARSSKVAKVFLLANGGLDGVGRYAWAVMGFDYRDLLEGKSIESRFKKWAEKKGISLGEKSFPHSWDVASYRSSDGRKLGKEFFLDSKNVWSYLADLNVSKGSLGSEVFKNFISKRKVANG
jgi:hypothetical protein